MFHLNKNLGRALQGKTMQIVRLSSNESYSAQRAKYQAQLTEMRKVWHAEFVQRQEEKERRLREEQRIMVQNKAVKIRERRLASLIRQEADRKRKEESAQRLRLTRARKHLQWDRMVEKQNERYSNVASALQHESQTWLSYDNMSKMITGDLFERESATTGFVSRYSKHWRYQVESGNYSFEKMMRPGEFVEPAYDRYERLERRRGTVRFKERQELSDYLSAMVNTGEEREKFQDIVSDFLNFDKDTRTRELGVQHKNHAWEEKWAARDKEEVLHEYGMSQYVYDTSKIDAYDEQHAQEYEDAGSDLEDTGVYDNRPSLDFGDKHRFIHPIKDRPKVQLDVDDESEFDDSDLFSDSDSDNECDAVYSIRGAGGADSAEEYRSAQLKSGADAATVEAVIAAIDEARALINNPQLYDFNEEGTTPAQAQVQHQFDALVEKLERLSTIAEERGMEQQSVGDAIYLMELVSYKVHLLSYGASAATADAIATAIEEAEDFIETLKNGDSDDYSDRTMADLLARLTGALEELKDLDVDISRPNFLIGDLQHWQDYEVEIRNGADRNTLNLVNRVTNKVDPLLDKIRNCEFYVKKEELSCQLQRLHSRLQRLRTKAEKKNIETEVLDQKISKIDSYFNESQDKEEEDFEEYEEESGDEESKKNVLLADIAAAHEELSSQEVKSTSVKVELARLESLSALITAGAEDIDEESARLRAKLEALRDAAVSERSVLARHNADVSVIDAEVAHLNNCIGNVHSMLSDSLPGASTTSDDDYYEDDGDEDDYDYNEYTGAPVQLEMRMLAKLEKLTAQRAAIDAKKPGRKRSRGRKSEEQK